MTRRKKSRQQQPARPAGASRAATTSSRKRNAPRSKHERPAQPAGAKRSNGRFPIVGIGASAGGLEAFAQMLAQLRPDTGMGFVYVQHLDRHHDSMLTGLLAKSAGMPVQEARDGMRVQPNQIYVITPNTYLGISAGRLTVTARSEAGEPHMSIDHFLRALAHDCGNQAIGVVLSGTASDGTLGLQAIKIEGVVLTFVDIHDMRQSLTLAQEARDYAQAMVESVQEPLLVVGANLQVNSASPAYYRMYRTSAANIEARMLFELEAGRWNLAPLRELMRELATGEHKTRTIEINGEFPRIGRKHLRFKATATKKSFILLAIEDLTGVSRPVERAGARDENAT
jgi:PAS domain-containing protein